MVRLVSGRRVVKQYAARAANLACSSATRGDGPTSIALIVAARRVGSALR
jgi:hypothetical protein